MAQSPQQDQTVPQSDLWEYQVNTKMYTNWAWRQEHCTPPTTLLSLYSELKHQDFGISQPSSAGWHAKESRLRLSTGDNYTSDKLGRENFWPTKPKDR